MICRKLNPVLLSVIFFFCLMPLRVVAGPRIQGFEGAEHAAAGRMVQIKLPRGSYLGSDPVLRLPNGILTNYGDLVALGGDFYGIPGRPIMSGSREAVREGIFTAGFNTLARSQAAVRELPRIVAVLNTEAKTVSDGVARGLTPEGIYEKIGSRFDKQWNCITGGSCSKIWWLKPGRYLRLAEDDFDHFGGHAVEAYQAGHHAALRTALLAHFSGDVTQLELAYAMNAYASHFLMDRFSSGHIRTPHHRLIQSVTPSIVGALLVTYMHDEDSRHGLHVHNQQGDVWQAFGDRYYFSVQNQENRRLLIRAMQMSADAIYSVWQQGMLPKRDKELDLIPTPDEPDLAQQQDITPLFQEDPVTHTLMRREDMRNVHDQRLTSSWWGWPTLAWLALQRGLPSQQQGQLVRAGYAADAAAYGLLITELDVSNA